MTVSNSKTPNPINGTQGGEKDLLSLQPAKGGNKMNQDCGE